MMTIASRAFHLLVPAAVITAFVTLYHATFLPQQNCLMQNIQGDFSVPNTVSHATSKNATVNVPSSAVVTESDYSGPFKIYENWTDPFPCVEANKNWKSVPGQRSPSHEGLLYVREMKTGSSTLAGVVLRIAHRKAKVLLPNSTLPCKIRVDHSPARALDYGARDKNKSFLLSLLRDPTKRAISQFFHFQVSEGRVTPTDANFQQFLQDHEDRMSNYYVKDLAMTRVRSRQLKSTNNYTELVQEIIHEYNFIGITERMDESLVVLKMLLGLELGDILYMSAKRQGSFTSSGTREGPTCIYIVPSFVTPGMKEFFASDYWKTYVAADMVLYKAAQASLDKTIEKLGRKEFEKNLAEFRMARERAQTRCDSRTIYRCDPRGEYIGGNSTCLMWDIGCGQECLDEFALEWA